MGKGFDSVRAASADINRRRSQGGFFIARFKLAPEEEAVVRFLEQGEDVMHAWVCQLPPREGQRFGDYTPTRDQVGDGSVPCPMAEAGLPRAFRGWINIIWRNGPVYKRDSDGRMERDSQNNPVIEKRGDGTFVWEAGITVFEELATLDKAFKGLSSRDFVVKRRGSGTSTRYSIMPYDPDSGPQPMTASDQALAAEKVDLTPFVTPKTYEEIKMLLMGQRPSAVSPQQGNGGDYNPWG